MSLKIRNPSLDHTGPSTKAKSPPNFSMPVEDAGKGGRRAIHLQFQAPLPVLARLQPDRALAQVQGVLDSEDGLGAEIAGRRPAEEVESNEWFRQGGTGLLREPEGNALRVHEPRVRLAAVTGKRNGDAGIERAERFGGLEGARLLFSAEHSLGIAQPLHGAGGFERHLRGIAAFHEGKLEGDVVPDGKNHLRSVGCRGVDGVVDREVSTGEFIGCGQLESKGISRQRGSSIRAVPRSPARQWRPPTA